MCSCVCLLVLLVISSIVYATMINNTASFCAENTLDGMSVYCVRPFHHRHVPDFETVPDCAAGAPTTAHWRARFEAGPVAAPAGRSVSGADVDVDAVGAPASFPSSTVGASAAADRLVPPMPAALALPRVAAPLDGPDTGAVSGRTSGSSSSFGRIVAGA